MNRSRRQDSEQTRRPRARGSTARDAAASRKTSSTKRKRTTRRSDAAWRVLVLECQVDVIARQGMRLGTLIAEMSRLSGDVLRLEISERADLKAGLRAAGRRAHRAAAVVAHSNERGIRLSNDAFLEWDELAEVLRPQRVEKLLFIACRAGLPQAAEALFRGVPTLRRIYACPELLAFSQAVPVSVLAPLIIGEEDVTPQERLVLQGLQLWKNNGLFFEFRREDFSNASARNQAEADTRFALWLKRLVNR